MKSEYTQVLTVHCCILCSTKREPWRCKLDQGQYDEVFGNEVTKRTGKINAITICDWWAMTCFVCLKLKYVMGKYGHERRIFKWFDDARKLFDVVSKVSTSCILVIPTERSQRDEILYLLAVPRRFISVTFDSLRIWG